MLLNDPANNGRVAAWLNHPSAMCQPALVAGLSPEQLVVLHAFKTSLAQQVEQLYATVPADRADPIVADLILRGIGHLLYEVG